MTIATSSAHLKDGNYYSYLWGRIQTARERILASIFIVDFEYDLELFEPLVELMFLLDQAQWRGVRVNLQIGGSNSNYTLLLLSRAAESFVRNQFSFESSLLSRSDVSSHRKIVIIDDEVILGSHNWSPGSLAGIHIQDSVAIESKELANYFVENVFEP